MFDGDGDGDGGEANGGGEDRLSALPDDIILCILLPLRSTAAAARTSVLSRRWRGLWAQLPEIRFPFPSAPAGVGPALAASASAAAAPALRLLHVACRDDRAAGAWLRAAAGRLAAGGELYFYNRTPGEEKDAGLSVLSWQCPSFQLPCFETAAKVWLRLGFVDLALPPDGVFAGLTELRLEHVNFEPRHELGYMVSTPRCPALRELRVARARGVVNLPIFSKTLLRIEFELVNGLEELTIVAPALRALNVHACFALKKPVAAILAPALELLWWSDAFNPSYALFGNARLLRLQQLTTFAIPVYGRYEYALLVDYVMLLRHFPVVSRLDLKLNYERELSQYEYLMEIITRLPNINVLSLWLHTKGHAIGASVFHLLRICPGIRKLQLTLLDDFMVDTPCTSICACVQQSHWSTGYTLDVLEEVEIRNFRGTDHDFAFVGVLLDMPTPIKKITITFHHLACPSDKVCKEFLSVGIPGTCFEVYRGTSEVLYEPPSSLFPKIPDDHCD